MSYTCPQTQEPLYSRLDLYNVATSGPLRDLTYQVGDGVMDEILPLLQALKDSGWTVHISHGFVLIRKDSTLATQQPPVVGHL